MEQIGDYIHSQYSSPGLHEIAKAKSKQKEIQEIKQPLKTQKQRKVSFRRGSSKNSIHEE